MSQLRRFSAPRSKALRAGLSTSTGPSSLSFIVVRPFADGARATSRVKALESQISELESEASRLLKGLETEKDGKRKLDRDLSRRIDELTKDIAAKVRPSSQQARHFQGRGESADVRILSAQNTEIEGLRERAKQYNDYDDLKRELEIMKVSASNPSRSSSCFADACSRSSSSSSAGETTTKTLSYQIRRRGSRPSRPGSLSSRC